MRNFVAKHDFNRASVHPDKSKIPPVTVEEGLFDYYAETADEVAGVVYQDSIGRVIGMVDPQSIVPMTPQDKDDPLFTPPCVRSIQVDDLGGLNFKITVDAEGYTKEEIEDKLRKVIPKVLAENGIQVESLSISSVV